MNIAIAAAARTASRPASLTRAGRLFISVFLLIVIEGALRKWVSSSLSLPLILLRDLLAVALIANALLGGHLRHSKVVLALFAWSCVVFGWGLLQIVSGESSPVIFIIGLRFWLLYTWFAVAAAASMTEADYRAALLAGAWMLLLMAPLAALQHFTPPGTFLNAQVDGDDEGVFQVVEGVVRTTGTFSFTSGYANFVALAAPVAFGLLAATKRSLTQYLLSIAVLIAFIVASTVSGSRTAVVGSGAMFGAYLVGRLLFSKLRDKPAAGAAVLISVLLLVVFLYFFQDAVVATQTRFQEAGEQEDFWSRVLAIFFGESQVYSQIDLIGHGVGYGSNLANFVRTGAPNEAFALAEAEGSRIMLEGGLLGLLYIVLKFAAVAYGIFRSVRLSARVNSPYPLLVWLTVGLAWITWTAVGQLTSNGLLGVILGFGLLVFRYPRLEIFPSRISRT